MAKTSPNAEETRQALLVAAKTLFARNGYDGTSVKELAREAGVNISLVSYHFEGKEGLYRTCLGQFGRERLAAAERILQAPKSSEEFRVRLRMFLDELMRCHIEEPELAAIVHREAEQATPIIPDLFRETFLQVFVTAKDFLRAAQKKNLFRADVEPHQATVFLFGGLFHHFQNENVAKKYFGHSMHDPKYRTKVADAIYRIFMSGCEEK
jgi:AcrR family transcriptional regulator